MNRLLGRVTITAALVAATGCAEEEPGRLPRPEVGADVSVTPVGRSTAIEGFAATIASERSAAVATRSSGTVERVTVDVGSKVRRGDPLVILDGKDVRARVAAARAQQVLAERTFSRVDNLTRQGAASQQERDRAEAGLEAARAAVSEAEAQEAYAVVRAPFDGVVTRREIEPGDLAQPGRPLVVLLAPGTLEIVSDIPAHRAGSVQEGMRVSVRLPGSVVPAVVTRVAPSLGDASRTLRVEARFETEPAGLLPGSYARLEVEGPKGGSRWIPEDAVVRRGQLTGVYAIEADTLRLRWVRLGLRRDGAVELLSGPAGDLTVVRRPEPELFDGRSVGSVRTEGWAPGRASKDGTEVDR